MQEFEADSEYILVLIINLLSQDWFARVPQRAFPQPVLVLAKGNARIVIEKTGPDLWLVSSM